jgi:hypothetical protein
MSDKSKKFEPQIGWIVTINHQQVSVLRLAETLDLDAIKVARGLDKAGYILSPDTFSISSDVAKLLEYENKAANAKPDLRVAPSMADVAESVSELDEEEMANE